ncbi:MAG: sigma-70 family RNA polymerase sigma factor [Nanobdellota archaeon]
MRQIKIQERPLNNGYILNKYINEIKKYPLLKPEEESELAYRLKKGDEKAKETLIKSNLRFVVSIAKQYRHENAPLSDMVNEGNKGLIKAAESFDETRGFKFISYAVWNIRASIIEYVRDQTNAIRIPKNKQRSLKENSEKVESLTHELLSDVPEHSVSEDHKVPLKARYIDHRLGNERTYEERLPNETFEVPGHRLDEHHLKARLESALEDIAKKNENIAYTLRKFYGIGEYESSMAGIAEEFDVKPQLIGYYLKKGKNMLKRYKSLKEFL